MILVFNIELDNKFENPNPSRNMDDTMLDVLFENSDLLKANMQTCWKSRLIHPKHVGVEANMHACLLNRLDCYLNLVEMLFFV